MIKSICILISFCSLTAYSQTWQSIPRIASATIPPYLNFARPYSQFEFNPYTNDLWFVNDSRVSIIENDGTVKIINDNEEMGPLDAGGNLRIAFTPSHTYYANWYGIMYSFDNYLSNQVLSGLTNFSNITSNNDTVYATVSSAIDEMKKYTEIGGVLPTNYFPEIVSAKGMSMYVHNIGSSDQIGYYYGPNWNDFSYIDNDPDYLGGDINDVSFSRLTEIFHVASINGISLAFDYSFYENITSSNTTNMPSNNVLEIDFDQNDNLWATFGDVNGIPIAIAKLDGTTWVDIYDNTNCPIDFSTYIGMAIDTLGNPYFCDNDSLYTIISTTSPLWLGVYDLSDNQFLIYPNPSKGNFTIDLPNGIIVDRIKILDVNGRVVYRSDYTKNVELMLGSGTYFVQLLNNSEVVGVNKMIIE